MFNPFLKRLAMDIPLLEGQTLGFICGLEITKDMIEMAEHPAIKKFKDSLKPKMEKKEGAAIIPIQGALAYNPDAWEMAFCGVEDSRSITDLLNNAAVDPEVKGVLLRMDTPGGMLLGGPEMADAVNTIKAAGKPVVAHTGGLMASLGYMIGSQADTIVANKSAIIGSIGVIASMVDYTDMFSKFGIKFEYFTNEAAKFKGAGAVGKPLSLAQRNNIQGSVDSAGQMFMEMVTKARPDVKPDAMQGQTFRGDEALKNGLIDQIGDEDFAFAILKKKMPEAATSGPYL
ncbi:MAG TPA: S49 family peptidase [Verrucomicrobiae bacterium]|jgi:signal peptide peptidase SppA